MLKLKSITNICIKKMKINDYVIKIEEGKKILADNNLAAICLRINFLDVC